MYLMAGWFGKIREEPLAWKVVAGYGRMTIFPLVNTYMKGESYVIMLQQFKQTIGVASACMNAKHKIARLHYVKETAEEVNTTYSSHHNNNSNTWKPDRRSNW